MEGPGLLGGRYELGDILGLGGMAEVREGWDVRLRRAVAIKLLHPGLSSQADVRERFKIEACAAAALNHPNIVGVYDFGDQDGTPFIVMERLPGDTLGDQIAQGPLPQAQVYEALRGVLSALAAAYDAGMLHRDIKPGNILRGASGNVKVGDFGIVKAPGSVHTTTGQLVGTLAYLSPNRIAGNPAAVSDDLYAAGVVGYEALTGRKPFTEEDIVPLARAIIEDRPPPVTALRPDVDPGLVDVVERAMSQDPLRRFPSAQAMSAALRPPTRVISPQLNREPTAPVIPAAAVRRRPTLLRTVGGSAAVLGAVAVAVLAFAMEQSPPTLPRAPEPVSISTPVPAPISVTTDPSPIPVVQPLPEPSPVIEQATQSEPRAIGNGKGSTGNGNSGKGNGNNGNGHGKTK